MASPTKRVDPKQIQKDVASFAALQKLSGYSPANAAYALPKVTAARDAMKAAQDAEAQAIAAQKAARDDANDAEWAFHNAILGSRDQVKAQYGNDSNEAQAVGLKKKSERKKPKKKAKPAPKA